MNTTDLADCLATELDFSKVAALLVIDRVFKTIVTAAINGEDISLSGFGTFKIEEGMTQCESNPAAAIKTGMNARRRLTFSATKAITQRVNR